MKNKKILKLIPLTFLFLIMIIPTISAFTVTNNGNTNLWSTATYPDYSANTNGTATSIRQQSNNTINEQITIANTTGGLYGIQIYLDYMNGAPVTFWSGGGTIQFYLVLDVYNGNEHMYSMFYIQKTTNQWGGSARLNVGIEQESVHSTAVGITGGTLMPSLITIANVIRTANVSYTIQMQRVNATYTQVRYSQFTLTQTETYTARNMMLYSENFTNTASFWTNATARLFLGFSGNGDFSAHISDMQIVESPTDINPNDPLLILPTEMTTEKDILTQIWDFLSNSWNFALQIWDILTMIFNYAVAIFWQIVPVLPLLLLVWLLDAVISSIITRSFKPVGLFLQTLYGMFMLILEKILAFLNFVANAIGAVIPL